MSTSVGTSTSNQWMQFYEQTVGEMSTSSSSSNLGFSDATIVATATTSLSPESINVLSTLHSAAAASDDDDHHHQQLTAPKGGPSKPIRRRSRASKKTPTTLLNANANNFRALVQQFTGCPLSLGNRRGPINLNFAQTGTAATSTMSASGYQQISHQEQRIRQQDNAYRHQRQPSYQLPDDQQQQQQQQLAVSIFDNVHHVHDALLSSSTPRSANADDHILDDFDLDNISLQDLNTGLLYSNEDQNDGNYFF